MTITSPTAAVKFNISLSTTLVEQARQCATTDGVSLSAWFAAAARRELARRHARQYAVWQAENLAPSLIADLDDTSAGTIPPSFALTDEAA